MVGEAGWGRTEVFQLTFGSHSSASPTHTVGLLSGNLKGTSKIRLIRFVLTGAIIVVYVPRYGRTHRNVLVKRVPANETLLYPLHESMDIVGTHVSIHVAFCSYI